MRRGTPSAKVFGAFLYSHRMVANLTMRQLGAKIGVPAATVSQVEKGERALKEPKIALWAKGLGIKEKILRDEWERLEYEYPDGPIVRRRDKSVTPGSLEELISGLTGPERNRVCGYIEALIENRNAG